MRLWNYCPSMVPSLLSSICMMYLQYRSIRAMLREPSSVFIADMHGLKEKP